GPQGFQFDDKPAITAGPTPGGQQALFDAWDDFACDANTCWTGLPVSRSTDGGRTWHVTWAAKMSAFGEGCSFSQFIGAQPLAIRGNTLAVVWNDGRLTGHSHILLATRPLTGGTWNLRFVTQGTGDEVQPGITADGGGFHIVYYGRTGSKLDIYDATSTDIAN